MCLTSAPPRTRLRAVHPLDRLEEDYRRRLTGDVRLPGDHRMARRGLLENNALRARSAQLARSSDRTGEFRRDVAGQHGQLLAAEPVAVAHRRASIQLPRPSVRVHRRRS